MAALTVFIALRLFFLRLILASNITSRIERALLYAVAILLRAPACLYILYYRQSPGESQTQEPAQLAGANAAHDRGLKKWINPHRAREPL